MYYGFDNFHPNKRLIKPLKLTNHGFAGRIKNRRFVLPASMDALSMSIDEYSRLNILPMLHKRALLNHHSLKQWGDCV